MGMVKTIGGDRLGSGKKQTVKLHNYERSTHDLSYIWRSTMAAGTIVPFMTELGLPGDTFDIDLDVDVKTHPTVGPLFGSFKVQVDVFMCPIRLYQGELHNNKLGIGMKMSDVKLPQLNMSAEWKYTQGGDNDNMQINPSCIFSYLNIRGLGRTVDGAQGTVLRQFNAIPYIAYHDIYKNYYANKQEANGYHINSPAPTILNYVDSIDDGDGHTVPTGIGAPVQLRRSSYLRLILSSDTEIDLSQIILETNAGDISAKDLFRQNERLRDEEDQAYVKVWDITLNTANLFVNKWRYIGGTDLIDQEPKLSAFPLENIDEMREDILVHTGTAGAFTIDNLTYAPYGESLKQTGVFWTKLQSQQGLLVKTYQSDLFNNWMQTEWIDGDNGINAVSAVSVEDGKFNIDQLNLANKVYNMLNRIAISGGTYDDWMDAVYAHERYRRAESPMYMGGLSKELVFQEVVSNSGTEDQPLATLGGKGVMSGKHKGGKVTVKVDEPCYVMGLISLTPRVDYSQGNKWDVNLKSMDDFHKPALDQIGFQDLITDQMAWWDTSFVGLGVPTFRSAGKQPAWTNYMTNVNQVRGNFAISSNEMFMTLNRRYEPNYGEGTGPLFGIGDLTTYIDPVKFNHIFAETARDAQNFWTQIRVGIEARRKMSAKLMPNL